MSDQLPIFGGPILSGSLSAISSPESAAGPTPSNLLDGPKTDPSGPARVPVSRFRARASKKAMTTNDTSGPLFTNSSPSADLQRSLENRLRQRMAANGSPEYALTWKMHDMPSGLPICALRARAHRTLGKDFSGWPTASASDLRSYSEASLVSFRETGQVSGHGLDLNAAAQMTGWAAPQSHDHKVGMNTDFQTIAVQAHLCGEVPGSDAQTEKSDASRLNPAFSLWLMGYPIEWAHCAARVTPLSRKSQRNL